MQDAPDTASRAATTDQHKGWSTLQRLWLILAILTALAFAVFANFPHVDLTVSSAFFDGEERFYARQSSFVVFARGLFNWIFTGACVLAVAGMIATRTWSRRFLSLTFAQWLFLGACLGAGPGLVANLGWKDHWGRARPITVTEFGGERTFTPIQTPGTQCIKNCSFVSGEASSMFMVFFAAAFLFPAWSRQLWATGIIMGLLAGLIRMVQGGHFLSDVIFAGIFMAMTAALLFYAFRAISATGFEPVTRASDRIARRDGTNA